MFKLISFLIGNSSFPADINFYFPTAPARAYSALHGEIANVWFDRYNVTPNAPEDTKSLIEVGKEIKVLIDGIMENDGIPLNRIAVGGFSMGGALALHMAYRFTPGLAGVFTLSSFLNDDSSITKETNIPSTPLYMCHGDRDTIVPISWGRKTYQDLIKLGIEKSEFITINNAKHELKKNELLGLFGWIQNILLPAENDESNKL